MGFLKLIVVLIGISNTISKHLNIPFKKSSIEERIVGGHDTTIEEHPYQVSITFDNYFICSGVLIRENVLITAAWCSIWSDYKEYYEVRAGTSSLKSGGSVSSVSKICTHPEFVSSYMDYDVSVWLLKNSFDLNNSTIRTIDLQAANEEVSTDTLGTVTGWGSTRHHQTSNVLQEVELSKMNNELCQKYYYPYVEITERMTCYGSDESGKYACCGDAGGPLVVNDTLIGIVSWSEKCCLKGFPTVFTDLVNEEIQDHINSCIESFK